MEHSTNGSQDAAWVVEAAKYVSNQVHRPQPECHYFLNGKIRNMLKRTFDKKAG